MHMDYTKIERKFRGKKVMITGHTGFKGSRLSLWLTELGATVAGSALAPSYVNAHFSPLELENDVDEKSARGRTGHTPQAGGHAPLAARARTPFRLPPPARSTALNSAPSAEEARMDEAKYSLKPSLTLRR